MFAMVLAVVFMFGMTPVCHAEDAVQQAQQAADAASQEVKDMGVLNPVNDFIAGIGKSDTEKQLRKEKRKAQKETKKAKKEAEKAQKDADKAAKQVKKDAEKAMNEGQEKAAEAGKGLKKGLKKMFGK